MASNGIAARTPIEFGIFDWIDSSPGSDIGAIYDNRLALLKAADQGGQIATYHLAEHHGTPLGLAPSPSVFIAAAARETTRIRLAPTTFVLPLYDPLRLVEEIAMLDHLSHGRLDVGIGRGSAPMESAMYGFDVPGMSTRYDTLAPFVLDALATGVLRLGELTDGQRPDVPMHVTTRQKPYPPLWYPTGNAATIPYLGDNGYNTLFGFAWFAPTAEEIGTVSDTYFHHFHAAQAAGGAPYALPGHPPRFGTMRHIYIADTADEAADTARRALTDFNDSFTYLFRQAHDDMVPTELDFEDLRKNSKILVGDPDSVSAQLTELILAGRLNYFAGVFSWGSLTARQSLSSFEHFQSHVIPDIRSAVRATRSTPATVG